MTLEEFAKSLDGQDFEKLVREAKTDSENRILGQGVAYIAECQALLSYDQHFDSLPEVLPHYTPEAWLAMLSA